MLETCLCRTDRVESRHILKSDKHCDNGASQNDQKDLFSIHIMKDFVTILSQCKIVSQGEFVPTNIITMYMWYAQTYRLTDRHTDKGYSVTIEVSVHIMV